MGTGSDLGDPDQPVPARSWRSFAVAVAALGLGLLAFAFAPFVLVAVAAAEHHSVFLGIDSWDPMDGLQYLAWLRDAHSGLIRNLFGSAHDGAVFLHPMWSPSGWVQAATGISDAAIMAFWTAAGALVLLAGCARLVTRQIAPERAGARAVALCLALFGGLTPVVLLLPAIDPAAATDLRLAGGDLVSAASLWGYVPMAIAVGLMPFAIEGVGRLLDGRRDRGTVFGTAALGLLVGWLHPWQGAALIVVALGLMAWRIRDRSVARSRAEGAARFRAEGAGQPRAYGPARRAHGHKRPHPQIAAPLLFLLAAGAPLVYYFVLSRVDAGWAVAELADKGATIPSPLVLVCVVPLALVAVIAGRRAGSDAVARGLVLWPLATLLVVAATPSGQDRALAGLGVPVAVLVVRAWPADLRRARWALATAAGLAATLVPAVLYTARTIDDLRSPYFTAGAELASSDVRAAALAARASGGGLILAPAALGTAVPALTDIASWVGHPIWTPDYSARAERAAALFGGSMTGSAARAFVLSTGARALIEPCRWTAPLAPTLAPLGFRERSVGCARVYVQG